VREVVFSLPEVHINLLWRFKQMDMVQDKVVCLGNFSKCASSTEVVESIAGLLAIQSVLTKQAGPIQVEATVLP
jgi:hypothetical protein